MPTAPILVVNRALGQLGEKPIEDFSDDSDKAGLSEREYERMVVGFFEQHDWNFASVRVASLPPLANAPPWGPVYAFQLPADCVRVRVTSLDRAEGGEGDPGWQIEGRTLVADESTVSLRYTKRVLEGEWPALFEDAVMFALAARLAFGITTKTALAEGLEKKAARALALAKAVDGQTGSPRRYISDVLTRERS